MTVDSVVSWNGNLGSWMGGIPSNHTFNSSAAGFTTPSYQWNLTGDGQSSSLVPSGLHATSWALTGLDRINLGTTPNIDATGVGERNVFSKSSTVKLQVTDQRDNAKGENTFTVRWHFPIESWKLVNTLPPTYTSVPATIPNGQKTSTNVVDESLQVWVEPSTWQARTLLSRGEQFAVTGAIAFGGGILKYLWTGAFSTAAKFTVPTWTAIASDSLAEEGVAEDRLDTCVNSRQQFASSVQSTKNFLAQVPNADARVFPESMVNNADILSMQRNFIMTPHIKRTTQTFFFKGDEYSAQGYLGETTGRLDGTTAVEIIGHYQYSRQSEE